MGSVLVVEPRLDILTDWQRSLRACGHVCVGATTGGDAIRLAANATPDVAVVQYELPDVLGKDVVSAIRARMPTTACVMVTSQWSLQIEFDSWESGACACVHGPVAADNIKELVERALRSVAFHRMSGHNGRVTFLAAAQPHATGRIVAKLVEFLRSPEDEPTLEGFGRRIGLSRGGFRNWCHTSNLKARAVLGLARGLRAVYRHQSCAADDAAELLQIIDPRTLAKFQVRSGGTPTRLPATVDDFLRNQQFIQRPEFVAVLRAALIAAGVSELAPQGKDSQSGDASAEAALSR